MISVVIKGGLGNQIFQILCALGYIYKTNNKLIIAKNLIHPNQHQNNDKELTVSILNKLFPDIEIIENLDTKDFYKYNETCSIFAYTDIHINQNINNILFNGYFINEKYLPDTINKFNYCIEKSLNTSKYDELTNNFENTYFIHIRLGDYINHFFHYVNLREYYNYCINKIKEQDSLAKFIICTNEYGPNLDVYINSFPKNNYYIIQDEKNDALDTLYIMSECQGGICSNSTLSWLGSYFQTKKKNDKINNDKINEKINNDKINNKEFIYMPYPWVQFVNGYNKENTIDVYPKWSQIYDTFTNKLILI